MVVSSSMGENTPPLTPPLYTAQGMPSFSDVALGYAVASPSLPLPFTLTAK